METQTEQKKVPKITKEQVRMLIPLVRNDFYFKDKRYCKLTLEHKGYYDLIKEFDLLNELYEVLKE